jgi:trans-2,3-dihydro-3-hydroxyanthranilate isomerase
MIPPDLVSIPSALNSNMCVTLIQNGGLMKRRGFVAGLGIPLMSGKASARNASTRAGVAFELWDVFTGEQLRGNGLAVVLDARGLPEETLGAMAREFGQSETTFVYPRSGTLDWSRGFRTRIFSKAGTDMKFAGHPTLGTAFALWARKRKRSEGSKVSLDLPVGLIPVRFQRDSTGAWEGEMEQVDPVFAERHDARVVAPLLGIPLDAIDTSVPIQCVSTGRPNLMVLVKSLEAVAGAVFDWRGLDAYFANGDRERGIYLLTREVITPKAAFHARKVTRSGDDPVTGSAAGCAISWLVKHGLVKTGERIVIEQGSEVGRLGELFAVADRVGDEVKRVRIGGRAVRSVRGLIEW